MPCGEVFTGPVEDSVEGTVYFGVPSAVAGREVSGVRFRFEDGKVVEATAEKGEDYLLSMLDADEGARYLGEIGIGTNYGISASHKEHTLRREARRYGPSGGRQVLRRDRRQERLQRPLGPHLRSARGRDPRRRRADPEERRVRRLRAGELGDTGG